MADIRAESVVGFDTETRPAFRKGESHLPCLVQVATARAVYLFQLARMDFSAAIAELMAAPGIVKAGVSIADDLRQLKLVFPFAERSVLDIGDVAYRHGLKPDGLAQPRRDFPGIPDSERHAHVELGGAAPVRRSRSTTPPRMPGPAGSCSCAFANWGWCDECRETQGLNILLAGKGVEHAI